MKFDKENKTLVLTEHDLQKTLEYLQFKGNVTLVMCEDEVSPIIPIEQIQFVRGGGIDG